MGKATLHTGSLLEMPPETKNGMPGKLEDSNWLVFLIIFAVLFVYFQTPSGSKKTQQSAQPNHPSLIKDQGQRKLAEKVKSLEHSLKTIDLKKRELENELRKAEMEGLMDDKGSPFDAEIRIDKLKIRIEDLEAAMTTKEAELAETRKQLSEYHLLDGYNG